MFSRRRMLASASLASALSFLPKSASIAGEHEDPVGSSYPRTTNELAYEAVQSSHFDLKKLTSLLQVDPSLARASWDWGFGDWETAIDAASHTANRKIIDLLMSYGARPTVFTFAAMGNLTAVKSICESVPNIQATHGPHGITLYQHAAAGNAKEVMAYLEELGGADDSQPNDVLTPEETEIYVGRYDFGQGNDDVLEVVIGKTVARLGVRRTGGTNRYMARTGENRFSIYGCPHVQIEFTVESGRAVTMSIRNGANHVRSTRIG